MNDTTDSENDAAPLAEGVRLQKVLANAGVASRRVAEKLIVEGRVRVNGEVVTELGSRIDPENDLVDVDGTAIQLDQSKRYVMLNKPRGVVSSMKDERGRQDLRGLHEGLGRAPLQRRTTGCRDQRAARPHERRRTRARPRASLLRRHQGLYREGRGQGHPADHPAPHEGHRAGGRPHRRRQGATAGRLVRRGGRARTRSSS